MNGLGPDADTILGHVVLAFSGMELPAWMAERLARAPTAGITLYRYENVESPSQVRALTHALQASAKPDLPLIVAADQEGGQFVALGDGTTTFPGNMALAATGDAGLAERVGRATGRELRALGVNVAYAPVLDVTTNPANPAVGIRSFGDDPVVVGRFASALVRGLQAEGVAATAKHFPGAGDLALDTHHALGIVAHDRRRLDELELVPFRAAIRAGVRLVMSGHFSVPGLTGSDSLPSTLSGRVMDELLRDELAFQGVSITDAINMEALAQGDGQLVEAMAALRAGVDLLLCAPDRAANERLERGLVHAASRGLFDTDRLTASAARITALRRWLGAQGRQPPLEVVGSVEHLALAREVAERSMTLVLDEAGLLPLRLEPGQRLLAVMPRPADLTPADTSSQVTPGLATAMRVHHAWVEETVTAIEPTTDEIAAVRARAAEADLLVIGTISASLLPAQATMVRELVATGVPAITVALRTPWDLLAYPESRTHVCSYSIVPAAMDALAAALFGRVPFGGRVPVRLPAPALATPART